MRIMKEYIALGFIKAGELFATFLLFLAFLEMFLYGNGYGLNQICLY